MVCRLLTRFTKPIDHPKIYKLAKTKAQSNLQQPHKPSASHLLHPSPPLPPPRTPPLSTPPTHVSRRPPALPELPRQLVRTRKTPSRPRWSARVVMMGCALLSDVHMDMVFAPWDVCSLASFFLFVRAVRWDRKVEELESTAIDQRRRVHSLCMEDRHRHGKPRPLLYNLDSKSLGFPTGFSRTTRELGISSDLLTARDRTPSVS